MILKNSLSASYSPRVGLSASCPVNVKSWSYKILQYKLILFSCFFCVQMWPKNPALLESFNTIYWLVRIQSLPFFGSTLHKVQGLATCGSIYENTSTKHQNNTRSEYWSFFAADTKVNYNSTELKCLSTTACMWTRYSTRCIYKSGP